MGKSIIQNLLLKIKLLPFSYMTNLLEAKKLMRVPLNPASEAMSLRGESRGSSSSGEYSPGTSPEDRRLLIISRNWGSTNWWSSRRSTTCSPSIPASCITCKQEPPHIYHTMQICLYLHSTFILNIFIYIISLRKEVSTLSFKRQWILTI